MGWLSDLADPAGIFSGDSGDFISNSLDPLGGFLDSVGVLPEWFSDAREDVSNTFDSINEFEKSQASGWWKKLKENPEQLLLGAGDPLGTKFWNEATGKEYTPFVNEWGGPTQEAYFNAQRQGIDTAPSQLSHAIAGMVAGGQAMGGLTNTFSNLGGLAELGQTGNALARAGAGATIGAGGSVLRGDNVFEGALRGGLQGGAQSFNFGGELGVENPLLQRTLNAGIRGGLNAELQGASPGRGAGAAILSSVGPQLAGAGMDYFAQLANRPPQAVEPTFNLNLGEDIITPMPDQDTYVPGSTDFDMTPYASGLSTNLNLGEDPGMAPVSLPKASSLEGFMAALGQGAPGGNAAWQTLGNLGTGLYGLYQGAQLGRMGRRTPAQRAAQDQLNALLSGGDITGLPGYKAGEQAVLRSMAAQGYLGSGNMMTALRDYGSDFYNQQLRSLSALAGLQPGQLEAQVGGLQLQGQGLQSLLAGAGRVNWRNLMNQFGALAGPFSGGPALPTGDMGE